MKTLFSTLAIVFFTVNLFAAVKQDTFSLFVKLVGIEEKTGSIYASVHIEDATFLVDEGVAGTIEKVSRFSEMTLEFRLPFGTYAVSVFHDINDNGYLDVGSWGIPKEPTGVSNDARGLMGPPKFKDALFEFTNDGQEIVIHL